MCSFPSSSNRTGRSTASVGISGKYVSAPLVVVKRILVGIPIWEGYRTLRSRKVCLWREFRPQLIACLQSMASQELGRGHALFSGWLKLDNLHRFAITGKY